MKKTLTVLCLVALSSLVIQLAYADESVGNKAQDAAGDATTGAKQTVRKAKRGVRKHTGHDTVGKDMKDKANDVKDNANNDAAKAQRKMGD